MMHHNSMRAYLVDLREKIVDAVLGRGMSKEEATRTFRVGAFSVKRYVKMVERGESLAPRKAPGRERKLDENGVKLLKEDLQARPAVSYEKRAEFLRKLLGVRVSKSTICRMIKRLGYTRKRSVGASERDEFLKAAWRVMVAEKVEPQRLVFVDEMDTNISLAPLYAYSPKGQRANAEVPRNRAPNTALLSTMSVEGMGPYFTVEGGRPLLRYSRPT